MLETHMKLSVKEGRISWKIFFARKMGKMDRKNEFFEFIKISSH